MVKRKRNKIILFVISLFSILFLSSCFMGDGKEYSIEYYYDDYLLDLEFDAYISGKTYDLPKLEGDFKGWYFDSKFNGNPHDKIFSFQKGKLVYYALFENDEIGNNELSKYISNTSNFKAVSQYDGITNTYSYDNGKMKIIDNAGISNYFYQKNNLWCFARYDDELSNYKIYTDGSAEYQIWKDSFLSFNFGFLDSNFYYNNKEESCFEIYNYFNELVFNNVFSKTMFDYCDSIKIYYNDTHFTKVECKVGFVSADKEFDFSIEFFDIGDVIVDSPSIISSVVSIETISDKYTVKLGTSFEDAYSNVNVKAYFENSLSDVIDISECRFESENYNPNEYGTYDVKVYYLDLSYTFKIEISMEAYGVIYADSYEYLYSLKDKYNYNIGLSDQSKVLVIPVDFTNHPADNNMVNNLELAFFGNSEDTGWESLKSYYYKSSYGKVNISGTVLPVFHTNKTSGYYERIDEDSAVNSIIKSALEYYDNSINYDDYDTDLDGYIDSIYIIYTAPVDYYGDSLYWAFSYEYFTDDYEYYDGVEADFYSFMGYDFFFDELANESKIKLNTETLIHESGHLFGLDDYYDYNQSIGPDGGIGGGDMMDNNVGDHNPYSKAILGWVEPTIVDSDLLNEDFDITLRPFASSGDCVAIFKDWNSSLYGEYFIIDFYHPSGLNALEAGSCGLFNDYGIRIYHIDSTLKQSISVYDSVWDLTKYNNSDTSHKLIRLIQADGLNEIEKDNLYGGNNDLFRMNSSFKNITWYDKSYANFEIFVKSISYDEAVITIKYID